MTCLLLAFLMLLGFSPSAHAQSLAFYADATARFDNPGAGGWQRVFDYGNGANSNNVVISQIGNTNDMRFHVLVGSTPRDVTAFGAIVAGETATWTGSITTSGFMTLRKNGVIVAQGQGQLPSPVAGAFLLIGRSHYPQDTNLVGSATMNAFDLNPQPINCPTGTGGFASSGTGGFRNEVLWLKWDCGSQTTFPAGYVVNKQWIDADGITFTAQITNITEDVLIYNTNAAASERLATAYAGVNPIGLIGRFVSVDPQFRLTLSTSLNGRAVSMPYIVAEAQELGGATANEALIVTTSGSGWTLLEKLGTVTDSISGQTATQSDPGDTAPGTALFSTTGQTVALDTLLRAGSGRRTAAAFGVRMPFDFSDAPLTATSYGSASHRTTAGGFAIGSGVTIETTAFDSPLADGDVDDGVTWPATFRARQTTLIVPVLGAGRLSLWIDYNGDKDFADAGERVATDVTDGGTGDLDGAANSSISLAVTPPADAVITPTFVRLRYAAATGAPSSGLFGFGEVQDYRITIINPSLSVSKTSLILSDGISASNAKALPGATVRYCILISNDGTNPASNIAISDAVPANLTFEAGSARTGADCNTAASTSGVSAANGTISATIASLAVGASSAVTFRARIN